MKKNKKFTRNNFSINIFFSITKCLSKKEFLASLSSCELFDEIESSDSEEHIEDKSQLAITIVTLRSIRKTQLS